MKMLKYYLAIDILLILMAWQATNLWISLFCIWSALSVTLVILAYGLNKPGIFRKKASGTIPVWVRWLFAPFLLCASLYNAIARKRDKVPAIQQVKGSLFLACRLFPSDLDALKQLGITAVLDVTAEFPGLQLSSQEYQLNYFNIPVLDHASPTEQQLLQGVHWIEEQIGKGGKVVVHCALGRGRSVMVTAAYLLTKEDTLSVMDAMNQIQSARATARLNKHQLAALTKVKKGGRLMLSDKLALIVNPVAGGGKWQEAKAQVQESLSSTYRLDMYQTTEAIGARQLAEQALADGHTTLVACGGDGTLTEVADVACHHQCRMAILPLGTANALSMVLLGNTSKLTPVEAACEAILAGEYTKVDTALCNQKRTLLVCAIGVEAKMIKSSHREAKNQKGQLAYIEHFFDALLETQANTYSVKFDSEQAMSVSTNSLVIANAAPPSTVLAQGGGRPNILDGYLDVNWLEGEADIAGLTELTLNGLFDSKFANAVQYRQCQQITVSCENTFYYAIDGEIFKDSQLAIEIQPASLNICVVPSVIQALQEKAE